MKKLILISFGFIAFSMMGCTLDDSGIPVVNKATNEYNSYWLGTLYQDSTYSDLERIAFHAENQTTYNTVYDGSWVNIGYPGGDPGYQQGVCTDVIVRALRCIDIDLQELIHNDLKANREYYNKRYRIKAIDNNIDHRRTQNIESYFTRLGAKIDVPNSPQNYKIGDILFWDLAAGHVGIVAGKLNQADGHSLVVHNIGGGPTYDDYLDSYIPNRVYRLTDDHLAKMKKDCTFKYDPSKDFKNHVQ